MLIDSLTRIIQLVLADLGLDTVNLKGPYVDFTDDSRFGDLTTNIALRLSKSLKKPPVAVASDIVNCIKKHLAEDVTGKYMQEVRIEGAGFINFYLSDAYFYEQLKEILIKKGDFARVDLGQGTRCLLEFVSANPTGPLSVAHARQAAVGDVLAHILTFLGYKVHREYYLNDEGNQINILGESIQLRLKELAGEKVDFPENHYQGEYIYDIAREIKDKGLKIEDFSEYGVEYILAIIRKELEDFGVGFDCWYSQRSLRESGKIEGALEFLRKNGFIYEEDKATWFASKQFGDDKDRVVIKSDGAYTYLAPDIAYHQDKYKRGFSQLINLWGPDHHGYVNRLKASVRALGADPDSLTIIIVQLASIFRQGKLVQMSTRRGEYITLREVLNEVGRDAARFFLLARRTSSHLDFDLEVAKKQTPENPVYYVQYAHARISSILRASKTKIDVDRLDLTTLKEKAEMALIKQLCQFFPTLNVCLKTQDPYLLTVYLQEVAEAFHKFYDQHRVLGQDEMITQSRLALIEATRITIACALELLGIGRPEHM